MDVKNIFIGLALGIIMLSSCGTQTEENTDGNSSNETIFILMTYQPKQCQKTPWEEWYALGKVNFIKEPTESEIAIAYYGTELNVEISDFQKVDSGKLTCLACYVCDTSYCYTTKVAIGDVTKLKENGWK